jgi:hypothetical protein
MYLSQISIFKNLSQSIRDIFLNNIKTMYFPANAIVHHHNKVLEFMAVIFVGSVG